MRQFIISLTISTLIFTACSSTQQVTKLPPKGQFIIFQDKENFKNNDYLAYEIISNRTYLWKPIQTTDLTQIFKGKHYLFWRNILSPSGSSYELPLPKKSWYFDQTPDGMHIAYILNSDLFVSNTYKSDAVMLKYKASRVLWLTNNKLVFSPPSRSSVFVLHKQEDDFVHPLILSTKPNVIQLRGSPDGKYLLFATRTFRSGGFLVW